MTSVRGNIMGINNSYCRMSGYSEQELLTMNVAELEAGLTPAEHKEQKVQAPGPPTLAITMQAIIIPFDNENIFQLPLLTNPARIFHQ